MIRLTPIVTRVMSAAVQAVEGSARVSVLLVVLGLGLITACGGGSATSPPSSIPTLTISKPPLVAPTITPPPPTVTPSAKPAPTLTRAVPSESTARHLRVFTQLWEAVRDTYVYPDFNGLDWDEVYGRYRARVETGIDDESFFQAMREMVAELNDDHSGFLSPEEVAEEEQELTGQLDYVGIGIYVTVSLEKGYAVLLQIFPDSPAERAGLRPHDRILEIDGVPVVGEGGEDFLDLLEGPAGSDVRVVAQAPGHEPRELAVTRARIQTQLPVDAYRIPGTDVGYVLIPTFWDQTVADRVRQRLDDLMAEGELAGLVVDMRINDGGIDSVLKDTLSIFTQGELGAFVSRDAKRTLDIAGRPVGNSHRLPLVILVGRETESFGEVFCGLLQESGRAWVVGRTTGGNVEILWQTEFEDGSRAWIASETFRPPSGADWEESGIVPDLEIPLDWDEFTPEEDPQLDAALDWLLLGLGE